MTKGQIHHFIIVLNTHIEAHAHVPNIFSVFDQHFQGAT